MNSEIEFHDSTLASVDLVCRDVIIRLVISDFVEKWGKVGSRATRRFRQAFPAGELPEPSWNRR